MIIHFLLVRILNENNSNNTYYYYYFISGLSGLNLSLLGIPTEEEFLAQYCQLRGMPSIPNWPFYMAFTFFRVAAILQGVYKRSLTSKLK